METFIVALCGLPSAGKTSIINSLVGKRVLETGLCRTTIEPTLIGPENILNFKMDRYKNYSVESDDGVKISLLDLPGISDSENQNKSFDEITNAWITSANVIIWVSDVKTAFLTEHERKEYVRIKKMIETNMLETGTLYQMAIMLSKYDEVYNPNTIITKFLDKKIDDEIVTEEEETTLNDSVKRVHKLFPDEKIMHYNTYGRIIWNEKVGDNLKKLVSKMVGTVKNNNSEFKLGWVKEDYEKKEVEILWKSFVEYYGKIYKIFKEHYRWNGIYNYTNEIKKNLKNIRCPKQINKDIDKIINSHIRELKIILSMDDKKLKICNFESKINRYVILYISTLFCNIPIVNSMEIITDYELEMLKVKKWTTYDLLYFTGIHNKSIISDSWDRNRIYINGNNEEEYATPIMKFTDMTKEIYDTFPYIKKLYELDIELMANKLLICSKPFQQKVLNRRKEIYGEEDIDIYAVINARLNNQIHSVLSYEIYALHKK